MCCDVGVLRGLAVYRNCVFGLFCGELCVAMCVLCVVEFVVCVCVKEEGVYSRVGVELESSVVSCSINVVLNLLRVCVLISVYMCCCC